MGCFFADREADARKTTVRMGWNLGKALRVNSALFAPRAETGRSPQEDQLETEMYIRIYRLLNELDGREVRKIDEDALPPAGGPDCGCAACGARHMPECD